MQPHPSDPERPAILDMQKLALDQCWRKGQIGDVTFIRVLVQQGYAPRDAQAELGLLRLEERRPDAEAVRMQKSREWLADR